jgi:predicted Zn-dependent peptidase
MKIVRKKLSNGIRGIVVPVKDSPTVTVLVMVETGSRFEDESNNGISHFLEHMMFKGTPSRPSARVITHELDALGAETNAFTSQEYTGYFTKGRKKHLKKFVDVVSDLYLHPLLPEEELNKERGVIIEEINLYQDQPMINVYDLLNRTMFEGHPLGRSVLGPKKNIKGLKREDFVDYRNKHYTSGATSVFVVGDVKPKDAFAEIEKKFAHLEKGKAPKYEKVEIKQRSPKVSVKYKKSDQSHFVMAFHAYDYHNKMVPATEVLTAVLGQGMSSRLFQRLREEMGVCYYVKAGQSLYDDTGIFLIRSGVDNSRVEEVVGEILKELRFIKKNGVEEDELQKAKEVIIGNFLMGLETSDSLAFYYADLEIKHKKLSKPQEFVKKIQSVSAKDVRKAANEIFKNKNMNLALIGPYKDGRKFYRMFKL